MSNRGGAALCRDFQRGSCRWGARCKFVHQAPAPTQHAQRGNRYAELSGSGGGGGWGGGGRGQGGGGVEGGEEGAEGGVVQGREGVGAADCAARAQVIRGERGGRARGEASTRLDCVDRLDCESIIAEDAEKERPLWRASVYAHWKYLPCDVGSDVSPEEARLLAYTQAQQGVPLPSIVASERAMLANADAAHAAFRSHRYTGPVRQPPSAPPAMAFPPPPLPRLPPCVHGASISPQCPPWCWRHAVRESHFASTACHCHGTIALLLLTHLLFPHAPTTVTLPLWPLSSLSIALPRCFALYPLL
ncbi:hypothetical protein CLOP_g14048 [Closterium sp. NIES-67]|nr:hypothetical protein CLOP_g14048 [Closterium sp. NIES-67]